MGIILIAQVINRKYNKNLSIVINKRTIDEQS